MPCGACLVILLTLAELLEMKITQVSAVQPVDSEFLKQELQELGVFYYWPNEGNLGDYLIAEATRQLFRDCDLKWREYTPENPPADESYVLVYGGGGRFVPHWGGMDLFQAHLTRPQVRRCVILPHSITGVDAFVKALDERHTVFCREKKTLAYCTALNHQSRFILSHDLGLGLCVEKLPGCLSMARPVEGDSAETLEQYKVLGSGMQAHVRFRMRQARVRLRLTGLRVAFVLRTDSEKNCKAESEWAYDLSLVYSGTCRETSCSIYLISMMADVLKPADVVVTDRLHVGIMSVLLGKEVYLLDNDYGKLSGVYENSLQNRPNVHLMSADCMWPCRLRLAWFLLNAPWRRWRRVLKSLLKR